MARERGDLVGSTFGILGNQLYLCVGGEGTHPTPCSAGTRSGHCCFCPWNSTTGRLQGRLNGQREGDLVGSTFGILGNQLYLCVGGEGTHPTPCSAGTRSGHCCFCPWNSAMGRLQGRLNGQREGGSCGFNIWDFGKPTLFVCRGGGGDSPNTLFGRDSFWALLLLPLEQRDGAPSRQAEWPERGGSCGFNICSMAKLVFLGGGGGLTEHPKARKGHP